MRGFRPRSRGWCVQRLTQDAYAGLLPRWYINYNFSMLRFVSYALDYQWAEAQTAQDAPRELAPGVSDARTRARQHRPLQEYGVREYLLYIFYPPLFIAGPIMTFNDFAAQLRRPLPVQTTHVAMYAVRCALLLLAMEFVLHYMYVNAIKNAHAWADNTPMELSMIGFWNLMFVWLKLLLPWRVFRLWALLDGVDPPENMIRAMFNNYSAMGFWRSWHRSYNLWVVRYVWWTDLGISTSLWAARATCCPPCSSCLRLWHCGTTCRLRCSRGRGSLRSSSRRRPRRATCCRAARTARSRGIGTCVRSAARSTCS